MDSKTFTGEQLLAALESGELERESAPIVGMAKKSEKPGCIAFSMGGCEDWIDLPIALLEKAKKPEIGQHPCKDHFHPIVELTFKQSTDPTIQNLLLLLSKQQSVSRAQFSQIAQAPVRSQGRQEPDDVLTFPVGMIQPTEIVSPRYSSQSRAMFTPRTLSPCPSSPTHVHCNNGIDFYVHCPAGYYGTCVINCNTGSYTTGCAPCG
jgi:hypothetical protein